MEKELKVNIFDYTALQLLYLILNYRTSKKIELKIKELIRYVEKDIYKDFFNSISGWNILQEQFNVVYTLKKTKASSQLN